MAYLGFTHGTAEWLSGKPGLVEAVFRDLIQNENALSDLGHQEFVEGSVRVVADQSRRVTILWNVDYSSGTGDEAWGFIRLDQDFGLRAEPSIGTEVLERCLYIFNQR